MHADAARRERQRDPPRPYTQLQRPAAAGQLCEEIDGLLDDLRIAPATEPLVVARGDSLAEVVLGHAG